MIDELIDDVRNLKKQRDFTTGKLKQKDHLNELVTFANGLKDAFDRAAANAGGTEEIYVIDGGESVPKNFVME